MQSNSFFKSLTIPKSSNLDRVAITKFLSKYVASELSKITKGCYYLKISKIWRDIIYLTGVDGTVIKEFKTHVPKEMLVRKALIHDTTLLTIINMIYFLNIKENELSKLFLYLLTLKFYGNLIHRQFTKFCDAEVWNLALDKISKKHNFQSQTGVSNAIIYLADKEFEKFRIKYESTNDDDKIWIYLNNFVYALRHRMSQSLKSFASIYYKVQQDENIKVKRSDPEDTSSGEDKNKNISQSIDSIVTDIIAYRQIDKDLLSQSQSKSGIRKDLAGYLLNRISNGKLREELKFIIILMNKVQPLSEICLSERKRNNLIKKILFGAKIYEYEVKDQIYKFLKSIDIDSEIRSADKEQAITFILHYLTLYIKRRICI